MAKADLSDMYRDYIAYLDKQEWPNLGQFVHEEAYYNGKGMWRSELFPMFAHKSRRSTATST